jgi:hypothetical protein
MFGYRVGGPKEDLERDYRDNAFGMPKSVVIDPTFDQKRKLQANANIEPTKGDKRYVRRKADGTFGKTVDVDKSLAADRKQTAKKKARKGQGIGATLKNSTSR